MSDGVLFLRCAVQTYAWGNTSPASLVAQLAQSGGHLAVEEGQPYAEFWMGTHSNGPSQVEGTGEGLADFLTKNTDYLGSSSRQHFGDVLPFLFKVLSVAKPLSIQIHPNQEQARQLHEANPEVYPEANHKPEMCVAISPFFALCGFRPYSRIVEYLRRVPELADLMGPDASNSFILTPTEQTFTTCFSNLMDRTLNSRDRVESAQKSILARNPKSDTADKASWDVFDWFSWITQNFYGDVGCFSVFVLNIVRLDPDEAMFLAAGVPHAYLSGECVECMACSDMVIRAGLTSKLCDVPNLCRLVDYSPVAPPDISLPPRDSRYVPPQREFGVEKIDVGPGQPGTIRGLPTISICLVLSGSAEMPDLSRGSVFVVPPDRAIPIQSAAGCTIFRAFVNLCLTN